MTSPHLLVVIRHAKASWKTHDADLGRPITRRGTRDAVVAGQLLAKLPLDLALVSPARRTQQTWQTLQLAGTTAAETTVEEVLYAGITPQVIERLRALPEDAASVAVVGHEPIMSELVLELAEASDLTALVEEKFPTMGFAILTTDRPWAQLAESSMTLAAFDAPRG